MKVRRTPTGRGGAGLVTAATLGLLGALAVSGCVSDPDCGICDPHNLVLESISGINYASRKVHLLSPECEGERCPGDLAEGHYFIEPIGPCEESEEALESPRGPQEYCRISPLVTTFGIEFVFNNLLDPTSVELVRRRPDNPNLYEVYDWKTQILGIEGPIARYNGDYYIGASGDPDQVTRAVSLSCIDNLRDRGEGYSHADYTDPTTDPCNGVDASTGQPMKLREGGVITATRGLWDSRSVGEGAGQTCSNPEDGPDTCCSECDFMLSTQVAKYGVLSGVDTGSGAVLEGKDLLRPDNLRRPQRPDAEGQPPPDGAIVCDVAGDPLVDCRDFVVGVDRSVEARRYEYGWSCDPHSDPGCEPETFALPAYDRLRETHPDDRPSWLERRDRTCSSSAQCQDPAGHNLPGWICVGENDDGDGCLLDADGPGCGGGVCVAPWFVTCRAQPDTTGAPGYCVDTRFDDRGAGACYRSTAPFSVCNDEGENCRTAAANTQLAHCDIDEDGRMLAAECCLADLGGPLVDDDGRCDPVSQHNLAPVARASRNRHMPEVARDCLCTDLADASPQCREAVAATCVDEQGRVRPDRAGEYAVKLVTRRGGVIYDPAIKGFEWQPADWGGVPRAALESCAEDRGLVAQRTVVDGWRAHDAFDHRAENFEDFDRAMCSGQSYTVVFQEPGDGEFVQDKRGNTLRGRSVYRFETPQFHVVPDSGFPSDNLRIGACEDFAISLSNKYDLSPFNLAKVEIWRIDEEGELLPPAPGCPMGPVAGGPGCAATDAERSEGGACMPPCLAVDTSGHQAGVLGVQIDPAEFRAVLLPTERYRVSVPGLSSIEQMNDPAAYQAAFWDACGMPLVVGVPGSGQPEYTYDFLIDDPKCKEDLDLDGLQFSCDNAKDVYNQDQSDFDRDGVGDVVDLCPVVPSASLNGADSDRDGIGNECDNCRQTVTQYNRDAEALGVPYYMFARNIPFQADADQDGIGDACDNCPVVANCDGYGPDEPYSVGEPIAFDDAGRCQRDDDANLIGDACAGLQQPDAAGPVGFGDEDDFDQDGIINVRDACPRQPLPDRIECTGDEQCPAGRTCEIADEQTTGVCDHIDTDGDSHGDICDTCAFAPNPLQIFDGVQQQGDEDADFIGDECEAGAICADRSDPRPMAFRRVSSSGYCCTLALDVAEDGSVTDRNSGEALFDPMGLPVRVDCSEAEQEARQCRRLPSDVQQMPGVIELPPGCDEALAEAGLDGHEDNVAVTLADVGGDLAALWDFQCLLPPRDQDFDALGDACDLCPFAFDPENTQYVDETGRLWPKDGAFCNGEFAPDVVCEQNMPPQDDGTGTGGETDGDEPTGGESTG